MTIRHATHLRAGRAALEFEDGLALPVRQPAFAKQDFARIEGHVRVRKSRGNAQDVAETLALPGREGSQRSEAVEVLLYVKPFEEFDGDADA